MATNPIRTSWDTTTNSDVFKTLVDSWFDSTDRPAMVEWPNMFLALTTSDEYERRGRYAALDMPGAVAEGENIPMHVPKFSKVLDYTQDAYGMGFRITDRMKRFEKIGLFKTLTQSLRRNMLEGKDIEVAKLWNNAGVNTYFAGFDTYALAYDSHTCLDDSATTYDNYLNAALSTSSLESALNYFDYMYDDQANIFTANPDTLYVNYALRITAGEILRSENKANEMSNTINLYPDWGLKTFVYHRLTSSTAWGLLAKNHPKYDVFVYTATEPDVITEGAPDTTRDTVVHSLQYFKAGFGDPRMVYVGDL